MEASFPEHSSDMHDRRWSDREGASAPAVAKATDPSAAKHGYKFCLVSLVQEPASLLVPSRVQRLLSELEISLRVDFLPP
jgi:hypothetical protein